MTLVATVERESVPSDDVSPSKYPPHRNVRVSGDKWEAFAAAVGERKRSAWLSDFIDAVNRDPAAWQAFREQAEERGELFSAALTKAISRRR